MMEIYINKQDLITFARELYKKSCGGYLDLEESTCVSQVEKFFKEHTSKNTVLGADKNITSQNLVSTPQISWGNDPILSSSSFTYTTDVSGNQLFNPYLGRNNWATSSLFPVPTSNSTNASRETNFSFDNSINLDTNS